MNVGESSLPIAVKCPLIGHHLVLPHDVPLPEKIITNLTKGNVSKIQGAISDGDRFYLFIKKDNVSGVSRVIFSELYECNNFNIFLLVNPQIPVNTQHRWMIIPVHLDGYIIALSNRDVYDVTIRSLDVFKEALLLAEEELP